MVPKLGGKAQAVSIYLVKNPIGDTKTLLVNLDILALSFTDRLKANPRLKCKFELSQLKIFCSNI